MTQQMLNCINNYNQKIQFLQTCGDQLLKSIEMLEIGMNRRKQQFQKPHPNEIIRMRVMVTDFFRMLAEIKTCKYFKTTKQFINFNEDFYKKTCDFFIEDLIQQFMVKLNKRNHDVF